VKKLLQKRDVDKWPITKPSQNQTTLLY
jgi:hypothetical protein